MGGSPRIRESITLPKGETPILECRKSRRNGFWALVYDRQVTNIVGVVHVFDVLFEQSESENIQPFLRTPLFVRNTTSNEEAFLLLQGKRQTMAVVLDKQDRAVGVVTVMGLIQF